MPDLTFTFSAAHLTRLVDAICRDEGYDPNSGETKTDFARRWQKERWVARVLRSEAEVGRRALAAPTSINIT